MTFTFMLDLTVAMGTVVMMLVTGIVEWRRKPYTRQDFSQAMERICRGVEELWRGQDEAMFSGKEVLAGNTEDLRQLSRQMLRDMLLNTCWILERIGPCCSDSLRDGPRSESREVEGAEVNRRAIEVMRQGTRLVFRLRWAQLRVAFRGDIETVFALTAEMAEAYALLWSELVRFLEARLRERLPAENLSFRTRAGGRAAL